MVWGAVVTGALAGCIGAASATAAPAELGVHNRAGCSSRDRNGVENVKAFEGWLGRKPDRVLDFTWVDSWSSMVKSSALLTQCWREAGYKHLTFSVALVPNDHVSTMAQGAAGAYDQYMRAIAENLVKAGYGDAIIRLGWEFDLPNFPWSAAKDPKAFVEDWRHTVGVMRSVPGAHFRFDYNWTLGGGHDKPGHSAPDAVYPGDDVVDLVGIDAYNTWWGPVPSPEVRWKTFVTEPYGLQWQADFAAKHHKRISFPEWGTGTRPDGHGMGDDPLFVANMAAWIATHDVAYHVYWDEMASDYNAQLSNGQYPGSAAAFTRAFGKGGPGPGR
jgi:hypothetical protein